MSREEFAARIENAEGILAALDLGLRPDQAPEGPLRAMWSELKAAYDTHLEPLLERIADYLDTFIPEPGDEGWEQYAATRDALNPAAIRLASDFSFTPDRHGRRTVRRHHT